MAQSFVAHIWLERAANGDSLWRGHLRHVQSRQQQHFENLDEVRDFVQRVTGVAWKGGRKNEGDDPPSRRARTRSHD